MREEYTGSSSEKLTWEKRKQRKTVKGKPIIPGEECTRNLHFVKNSLLHTLTNKRYNMKMKSKKKKGRGKIDNKIKVSMKQK